MKRQSRSTGCPVQAELREAGAILSLTFQAIGRGTANVAVTEAGVKNVQLQPIPVSAPSLSINVQ